MWSKPDFGSRSYLPAKTDSECPQMHTSSIGVETKMFHWQELWITLWINVIQAAVLQHRSNMPLKIVMFTMFHFHFPIHSQNSRLTPYIPMIPSCYFLVYVGHINLNWSIIDEVHAILDFNFENCFMPGAAWDWLPFWTHFASECLLFMGHFQLSSIIRHPVAGLEKAC